MKKYNPTVFEIALPFQFTKYISLKWLCKHNILVMI